ncbi:hypothetical protein BC936DRAFT_145448 [Jimgerdemannia flammicorona]|uniref:Uncharacterized protein n=1 Tax=Jimgerdemannia flammicorona TaxID=994334 RepID=A0A433D9Z6_9FUNG|nr:hypothetical protein BC936DRAFT_145448 [Jimgerdemannia flammicorona]
MNYNSHSDTDHIHGPSCVHTHTPYHQTLDELDFQRSLHGACSQPDLARAQLLLDRKGARIVNERDANGYTPLHYAARTGNRTLCELLLSHSAEPNAQTASVLTTVFPSLLLPFSPFLLLPVRPNSSTRNTLSTASPPRRFTRPPRRRAPSSLS